MWLLCLPLLAMALGAAPGVARADAGIEGLSHAGTGTPTGTKRAESVLWHNDGIWWGNLWDTVSGDFHIFRLNTQTQKWEDTGTATDTRANTHSDVLWTGSKLYVSSHTFVNDGQPAVSGFASNLYRYSYDATTKKYTLDAGFPTQINNVKTETLTVDRDSTGKLWATWQQSSQIYVNSTTGSGDVWGTPAPIPGADVTIDDTSSLIAFNGGILVLWGDQSGGATNGMHFAIHPPGGSHTSGWSERKAAISGPKISDDHINLKWLESDGGRIFAAIKTSATAGADPLIVLLVLDTRPAANPSQTWQRYTIAKVSECPNRVIVLVDKTNNLLRTFATYPDPDANVCSSSGGAIYEKDSPLPPQGSTAFSFPAGRGTLRIADTSNPVVHNVSSTKQNVSAAEGGLAVIADNGQTARYWHYFTPLGAATPAPTASFTATPTSGTAPLPVTFDDTSTGSPTSWAWDFGDGATSTAQSPSHTYTAAGTYTATLTATNTGGSNSTTQIITVTAPTPAAPTASFTATPTSGTAPLPVTFDDTSTGSPTSWAWDFGDGATSTAQSPSHTYTAAGTYTATLTATNTEGPSAPASRTITVTGPPPAGTIKRESVSTVLTSTAATTRTIPTPSGTTAGDLLVSCLTLTGGAVNGAPAGWSPIASATGATNPKVYGYYKVATASEPAGYTWTTTSVTGSAGIARYSGASGLDGPATSEASNTATTSAAVPGVTTTTANVMLVGCMGINSGTTTITAPSSLTQAWELGVRASELADGPQAAAGASGVKTWTFSASRAWAGWLVGLRPL
jgi:PKD repeat protein